MERGKIIKNGNMNLENLIVSKDELLDSSKILVVNSGTSLSDKTTILEEIEFDEKWALEKAIKAATNSKCKSQRGVVIWHRKTGTNSCGWNAPPKPFICDGSDKCRANCAKTAVHAEQAALLDALGWSDIYSMSECEMIHVKIVNGLPVVSEKPSCWQCSKLILAAGLKSMWLYQKEGFVEYTPYDFHRLTLENCELT